MQSNNIKLIIDKFKQLREREEQVFDYSKLGNNGFQSKEDIVFDMYYSFSDSLGSEINSLPEDNYTLEMLLKWIDNLDYWIKSKNGAKLSDATKALLKYRKDLRGKLIDIYAPLSRKLSAAQLTKESESMELSKEKLTLKQQILLLHSLGILNREDISNLPYTKQAKLFSYLLNRSEKKVKDYISNIDKKNGNPDFFIFKDDNVKTVNELLESTDLQEHTVKL